MAEGYKAPACMSMPITELRRKTPEDLIEYALEIQRYSLYIQRLLNRERSWMKWCLSKRDELAASNLAELEIGHGWEERMVRAKNGTDACVAVNAFLRKVTMRSEALAGIPDELSKIASIINDMRFVAMKREKHGE